MLAVRESCDCSGELLELVAGFSLKVLPDFLKYLSPLSRDVRTTFFFYFLFFSSFIIKGKEVAAIFVYCKKEFR